MLKLYKRVSGVLQYHEAWFADGNVIEHWGAVGETGQTKEHRLPKKADAGEGIEAILRPALDAGFAPADDEQAILLIEYPVDGFGSTEDLEKRYRLQERMDQTLGWAGLGHCDGGSVGSGTMEVCCVVVDFDIAKRVIAADLKGTEFADFSRIYREDEA
jgi:hypothetical protein